MPITALYAALLAPLFILLSIRVIGQRRAVRVSIGHGDDALLLRRMRVHANFTEYVPFALISLGLAESLAAPSIILHAIGAILVFGRYAHAFGVSQSPENFTIRVTGMVSTFTAIGGAALIGLVYALAKF
jgi:uncharacterized protein